MHTINITFQHGWSFGSSCWNAWIDLLSQDSTTASPRSEQVRIEKYFVADRGYFGETALEDRSRFMPVARGTGQSLNVIVAHSFGLHLITPAELARADILCAFGSFLSFHPDAEPRARRSKRIITRMLEQFKTDPQSVVAEFFSNCYHPGVAPAMPLDQADFQLLEQDLKRLDAGAVSLKSLESVKRILLFHDEQDKIIPIEQAYDLRERLPNSTLILSSGAGHALPFARPEWAFRQLLTTVENLQPMVRSPFSPVYYAW